MRDFDSICVVSGSRADFGLLRNVLDEISKQDDFGFELMVVRGTQITRISQDVYIRMSDKSIQDMFESNDYIANSPQEISDMIASVISGCTFEFEKRKPSLILVLGDRHEILGTAIASTLNGIPIAHISGGERTSGSYDDHFRHAITKMSHIHFVKEQINRHRVIQLGENPNSVFVVGNLGRDSLKRVKLKSREVLSQEFSIKFGKKNLMITYHPETQQSHTNFQGIEELIEALALFPEVTLIFTSPSNDVGSKEIKQLISEFVETHPNAYLFDSLGQDNYLSILNICDGLVGNSSSGIYEAPLLGVQSLNIGNRQSGRDFPTSVIHAATNRAEIEEKIRDILIGGKNSSYTVEEKTRLTNSASELIVKVLNHMEIKSLIPKRFFDIDSRV